MSMRPNAAEFAQMEHAIETAKQRAAERAGRPTPEPEHVGPTEADREVLAEIWKASPTEYDRILELADGDIARAAASIRAVAGISMGHPDAPRVIRKGASDDA